MKTLMAKGLYKNDVIIEKDNKFRIVKIEHNNNKGIVEVWLGRNGQQTKLFNPNDVVIIE
jgi:hypothetical protein